MECKAFNYFVTEQFFYVNAKINLARSGHSIPGVRGKPPLSSHVTPTPDRINRLGKDVTPKPLFLGKREQHSPAPMQSYVAVPSLSAIAPLSAATMQPFVEHERARLLTT